MKLTTTSNGWEIATGEDGQVTGRAQFSEDRTRRYVLIRRWSYTCVPDGVEGALPLTWVMLNPSTAGAADDDPTIRKCVGYAKRWGYGGIRVLNLFDLIATDPRELGADPSPCSPENQRAWEEWLLPWNGQEWSSLELKPDVVVGWGDGALRTHWHPGAVADRRDEWAVRMFVRAGVEPTCLGVTRNHQPLHPGRTPYDLERIPWKVL